MACTPAAVWNTTKKWTEVGLGRAVIEVL
jgi:hypothetical protein